MAGKAIFVVRAVVAEPSLRARFDHWYSTDHLPWAVRVFKAEKAWRLWSDSDPSVHVAVYQFADKDRLEADVTVHMRGDHILASRATVRDCV